MFIKGNDSAKSLRLRGSKLLMLLLEARLFARKKNKNKRTERKGKLDVFTQEAIWIREGETTPAAVSNRQ